MNEKVKKHVIIMSVIGICMSGIAILVAKSVFMLVIMGIDTTWMQRGISCNPAAGIWHSVYGSFWFESYIGVEWGNPVGGGWNYCTAGLL